MNDIDKIGATMSSREIAALCDKRHDHVMADCRKLAEFYSQTDSPEKAGELVKASSYVDLSNRTVPCFALTREASLDLVTGYSLAHRHAVNKRWQQLENQIAVPALPDFTNPALAARAWADEVEQKIALKQKAAEDAPKVAALDRLTSADGSMCITDAAKNLQTQPKAVFGWMQNNQWIYRRPGAATWIAYQDKLQRGVLEHKITTVYRTDGSEKVTTQVLVTAKGLTELAQKLRNADLH